MCLVVNGEFGKVSLCWLVRQMNSRIVFASGESKKLNQANADVCVCVCNGVLKH